MEIQAYLSTNKVDRAIPLRVHRLIRVAPVSLIWIYAQTRVHSPDVGNSSPRAASKMALMARGRMAGEPLVVEWWPVRSTPAPAPSSVQQMRWR
jgi:hypothetical protein